MTTTSHEDTYQKPPTSNGGHGSRRARDASPRSRQVFVRLSDQEYDDLATAAKRAELTTTGFVATAALAAASGQRCPTEPAAGITRAELRELQRDLFAARAELGRIGGNLNQAVRTLNRVGRPPTGLDDAVARCATAMSNLDTLVDEVDGRLR